jgi:hypothetical protein
MLITENFEKWKTKPMRFLLCTFLVEKYYVMILQNFKYLFCKFTSIAWTVFYKGF